MLPWCRLRKIQRGAAFHPDLSGHPGQRAGKRRKTFPCAEKGENSAVQIVKRRSRGARLNRFASLRKKGNPSLSDAISRVSRGGVKGILS